MEYYLCIVGRFNGNEQIFQECIERGIFQYFDATRQKGAATAIKQGDVLLLTTNNLLKGYGIASGGSIAANKGHDDHWVTIQVKDGWHLVEKDIPLPYGLYWHTLQGTKRSIVKKMDSKWTTEILLRLKQARHEGSEERAFPIHLSELGVGLNTPNPFFKIPDIQRGLVWNATRCEVLWDSILRGMPIGAISVHERQTPDSDSQWEIFDGQQRSYAASLGYADWPPREPPPSTWKEVARRNQPILWIDLKPKEKHGRKFVLMVTTPAHPWGYNLSNDEKADNRLHVWEQREAVSKIDDAWRVGKENGGRGARPYTYELWPVKAGLPIPFSLLRQYVEDNSDVEYAMFLKYCIQKFGSYNWTRFFHNGDISNSQPAKEWMSIAHESALEEPAEWKSIIYAIKKISDYSVVALNCKVESDDLGLYFKRLNKQGIEPDDEEIRYSMLKSKIQKDSSQANTFKVLDAQATKRRTRPAWLADVAIRFWLSKQEGWKWKRSVSPADIEQVARTRDAFLNFIAGSGDKDLTKLLEALDKVLLENDAGLLRWHLSELYKFGRGDCLTLFFLRELYEDHPSDLFIALATTVLWFGDDIPNCAQCLWEAPNIKTGVFRAIQRGYLTRIFDHSDLSKWGTNIYQKIEGNNDDWGSAESVVEDPYIGAALGHIWDGFKGGSGCSLLLYACKEYIIDNFGDYNPDDPVWREQNRPWDYDHILPKDWVGQKRISGQTYLVRKFLWSIGNSAPLPFSLNREKNANPPDKYPDGQEDSAKRLYVDWDEVNQFGSDKKEYDRLDRNKRASVYFVKSTTKRMIKMLNNWYDSCGIEKLMSFESCEDLRHKLFEEMGNAFSKSEDFQNSFVWFTHGAKQYIIRSTSDWARPCLALGVCGKVPRANEKQTSYVQCMLGVAADGKALKFGIRRHPDAIDIPGGDWWLDNQINEVALENVVVDDIVHALTKLKEKFGFEPQGVP